MPLSEYEQRVLEQLERDLGDDPKLKSAMERPSVNKGRVVLASAGVIVGLVVVLLGSMSQLPILGIAGFALMAGSALWGLVMPQGKPGAAKASKAPTVNRPSPKAKPASGKSFTERMEERFDRRRNEGDL